MAKKATMARPPSRADMPDSPSRKSATTPVASQSRIAPISPPIAAKPYVAIVRPIGLDIASLSP